MGVTYNFIVNAAGTEKDRSIMGNRCDSLTVGNVLRRDVKKEGEGKVYRNSITVLYFLYTLFLLCKLNTILK